MNVDLLTEHHLELLSLNGGCTGSSESTLVKMSQCWKTHVTTQLNTHADVSILIYIYTNHVRTSDGGNGNDSVSLPIILLKIKVNQMLQTSYISLLLVSIL